MNKHIIFFLLILEPLLFLYAQNYTLTITKSPDYTGTLPSHKPIHASQSEAITELRKILTQLHEQGYFLADADTQSSAQFIKAVINPGKVFKWAHLKQGNLNPVLAQKAGFSEKQFTGKKFDGQSLGKLREKILTYYENNGYPFAWIKLDSVDINEEEIRAVLHVEKDRFVKLDSIQVIGSAKVNIGFLQRYLSLLPGKPYNESMLRASGNKLRQLPFVVQSKAAEMRLSEKHNKFLLFLNKKNASQFDGIVGIQPDNITGKTVVTGDIKIKLVNGIFKNAETFDLEWRRLQFQTQDFKGRVIYPYLFGSPFGADYSLKIYRRDTTFVDINNDGGVQFYFSALNYLKVHTRLRQSNLLSTAGLENVTNLPSYADISSSLNGFGVFYENLDYRFNPRKGLSIQANASAGNRRIRKNPRINDAAYANLDLNSTQYMYDFHLNAYLPLRGNSILKMGLQSASVFGSAQLFRNELIRIGGLKTLRGFDEESIFASAYIIPTIEYRFVFSENSCLLAFAEGAWYENNSLGTYVKDTPLSFGAGMNLETRAGILTLMYAIGNQFKQGFDARNGKIHFGLTALF